MLLLLAIEFIEFPERKDALLSTMSSDVIFDASGSLGLFLDDGKCTITSPNWTLNHDREHDWCSNIASKTENPWISFSLPKKAMKIKGYSLRSGCCYHFCCCDPETNQYVDADCCCDLYSFSLQGSNDNHTWKVIHQIQKDQSFYRCKTQTYEFDLTEAFKYIRFVVDEQFPGCLKCVQINQIELYGEAIHSLYYDNQYDIEENEESVSIIGKVKKY